MAYDEIAKAFGPSCAAITLKSLTPLNLAQPHQHPEKIMVLVEPFFSTIKTSANPHCYNAPAPICSSLRALNKFS